MYRSVPMHVPPIVPLNPKVQIAANRVQFKQLVGTSLQGRVMSANKPISMDGSERERKCELLSAGIQFDLSMFPKTPEHPAVRLLRYCAGLPRGSLGPPGKAPGKAGTGTCSAATTEDSRRIHLLCTASDPRNGNSRTIPDGVLRRKQ
jgi:hypothetical protein